MQPWFELYRLAVLETDRTKQPDRLHAAEGAIKARLAELGDMHDIPGVGALRNALAVLRLLEKHEK